MRYLAIKTNTPDSKYIGIRQFETETEKEEINSRYEGLDIKEFDESELDAMLKWVNFNPKGQIKKIIESNDIISNLVEYIEKTIRPDLIKNTINYMLYNPKVKVISSADKNFDKAKDSENIFKENKDIILLKRGSLRPLEFSTLGEFWAEPSIEIDETEYGSNVFYIRDVVYSYLSIDNETILDGFISNLGNLDIGQIEIKLPKEVLSKIDFKKYLKKYIAKDIDDIIIDIVNGNLGEIYNEDFYKIYKEGCEILGVPIEYKVEYYESINEYFEEMAIKAVKSLNLESFIFYEKGFVPTERGVASKERKYQRIINELAEEKVVKSDRLRENYLEKARNVIKEVIKYRKYCKKSGMSFNVNFDNLLEHICMIEINEYIDNEICIDLSSLLLTDECKFDFLFKGIDYTSKFTYVKLETKNEIMKMIPASPELEYPMAREMERHFYIHYGPTNSGKTYQSIEALKQSESGTYLGPLRLLALEIQDKLNDSGVPCSLLTGEEEEIIPEAQHVSSTIEKANLFEEFDTCVIDECQMISDEFRGFAWSRAILGMRAKNIYLCMGPEAVDLCIKLIELCGDTYELIEHKRRSDLVVEKTGYQTKPFEISKDTIEEGDALIVFSKKKVLNVAANLIDMGIKTSLIYGNLPYSVRKRQVERFLNHETDVVVSTDAIGMGINLPVRRIIFLEDEKFNGKQVVPLDVSSVKQIAGRAGRNTETGYVNTSKDIEFIDSLLNQETPIVKKAYLGFSDEIISINAELSDILKVWKTIETSDIFTRMDINRYLDLDSRIYVKVSKKDKLKMINIPFDEGNPYILDIWMDYCHLYEAGQELYIPECEGDELNNLEDYYKGLDLYYSFSKNFGYIIDLDWLAKEKERVSDLINTSLIKDISKHQRKCKQCGRPLKWDYPFGICDRCFHGGDRWYMEDNSSYNRSDSDNRNKYRSRNKSHNDPNRKLTNKDKKKIKKKRKK